MTNQAAENLAPAADATASTGETPATLAPFPSSEALRDYGQRLSDALWARAQVLSAPARTKATLPVMLAAVAALVVARDLVLGASEGPTPAAAMVAPPEPSGRATSEKVLPPTNVPSALRTWLGQPVQPVTRNIFALPAAHSAAPQAKSDRESVDSIQGRVALPSPSSLAVGPGQSAASGAPGQDTQARQIRLQSTLMGAVPTALVNGQMMREGDVVASGSGSSWIEFRVLKIEARRIILEREGVRSEIPLD